MRSRWIGGGARSLILGFGIRIGGRGGSGGSEDWCNGLCGVGFGTVSRSRRGWSGGERALLLFGISSSVIIWSDVSANVWDLEDKRQSAPPAPFGFQGNFL